MSGDAPKPLGLFKTYACLSVAFGCSAYRLFRLADLYSVNILVGDQWIFDDATLFEHHSLFDIFRWQHGPHRQGLGGIVSKFLEPAIKWNSRYEAFGIVVILCLSGFAAVWLKTRAFGKLTPWDAIIPLLFLTPVQYQTFLGAANPSHGPLPLLLVMLYCLTWTLKRDLMKYSAVLFVNLCLIYTGFGLFIGLLTPLLAELDYRQRKSKIAFIGLAISLLSFGSFFVGYKYLPAADCFSPAPTNPGYYWLFAGFMLSTFVGIQPTQMLVSAILLGTVLLTCMILAGWFLWRKVWLQSEESTPAATIAAILVGYTLLFCFATAYGRTCLGLAAAQGSRYMTYLVIGFLGLYFAVSCIKDTSNRNAGLIAVLGLALMSAAPIRRNDEHVIAQFSAGRRAWRDCYLRKHSVQQCDVETRFPICWSPEPPDLQSKLDILRQKRVNLFESATP